ncbi:hypothetical protein D3232_10575, partial [Staphylococcus aureus]
NKIAKTAIITIFFMIALLNRFIIQKHVYYENELCYSIPDFIVIKLIFNIKGVYHVFKCSTIH